ncbi:MAG: 23S rRNA (adenine(2503)-C(2))-methyltransferase RlmN [Candidatus Promineifilaceae bacterium]
MDKIQSVYDLSLDELTSLVSDLGEPSFRSIQIWQWLYKRYAVDYQSMTNLPRSFRDNLRNILPFPEPEIVAFQRSTDEHAEKVLYKLPDGNHIEAVLMRYKKRRTLCISTQAGCAMGCVFCATGQMGFARNLSVGEIIHQVLYFAGRLSEDGDRVTNIVVMGMGEPLHNYDNTLAAVDILTDREGFDLGARKITISTVGLVPAIRRFADECRQIRLAISLHAASDVERNKLIPIGKRWPIAELMEAARYYILQTGRRITFEWALINEENDTLEQAQRLGSLLQGMLCHVNLIPLNPTREYGGQPSSESRVAAFQRELDRYGVSSTVRVRRGIDIQAGCGQLRDRVGRGERS